MAKRFSSDYTVDDILGLYKVRINDDDERRLREIAPAIRALCRMEHEVTIPAQYKAITKAVRTPFMRDSRIRIASSRVGRRPVVHITPKNEADKAYREAANIGERWDTALVERINKETAADIDFNNAAALVTDGDSILKVAHRPDAWANFPERGDEDADAYDAKVSMYKRGVDLPIVWRNLDRMCVVREGGEYGDAWFLEYGEYNRPYLSSRYGMREIDDKLVTPRRMLEGKPMPDGLRTSVTGRTIKVEFWTPSEWHVIIDGSEAPGFPKANPYAPYMPYMTATAYEMESLLYSLMYLVPRLDELLTMKLNWAVLGAYPNPVIKTLPNQTGLPQMDMPTGNIDEADSNREAPLRWSPGKAIDLPVGKDIGFLVPPPVGKDINDLVVIFKGLIDVAGVPSIMRGISGSGDSGYLANQMLAAVQMSHQLAVIALQRQREKALEFSHWLVREKVRQPVYVLGYSIIHKNTGKPVAKSTEQWLGLGPKPDKGKLPKNVADVDLLGPVTCTFRPTLPTDAQAAAMIALQLTNAPKPLYDRRNALEKLMQEEDADGIMDAIWVEEALNAEPLRSRAIEEALADADMSQPKPSFVGLNGQELLGAGGLLGADGMPAAGGPAPYVGSIPLQGMPMPGGAMVPGLNKPIVPGQPGGAGLSGVPGAVGGSPAGSYPGLPSRR